jgi:hypothetical protein
MLSIIQPVWTAEMRAAAGACFGIEDHERDAFLGALEEGR